MTVRFDDSLPLLARAVSNELGLDNLLSGVVLRDSTGRLAFFASADLSQDTVDRLSCRLRTDLGPYARADRAVAGVGEFGAEGVLNDSSVQFVTVGGHRLRLVDRRLVGADWLRTPAPAAAPPPRHVFASLKGGVGRSTALSVTAAYLASRGRRVLAIDLDMEAPGLGAMLLDDATMPEFGLIDALVENGMGPLNDSFLADLVGPSSLADRGRIEVIPAFGRRSIAHPGDVLAKIARAYTEDLRPDGTPASILDQVRDLVDTFADPLRYDAILIDARAGLHETTAASILGLGAEVFLFGLNEPQTFQGYAAMLAHLARFIPPSGLVPEWLERITMVQGRAPNAESHVDFTERCRTLFGQVGLTSTVAVAAQTVLLPAEPFNNVPWDEELPDDDLGLDENAWMRPAIAVFDDPRFRHFNPTSQRDTLSEEVYRLSFGPLLNRVTEAWADQGLEGR